MEKANPSESTPPPTDHGNLGGLRYSFSASHNRRTEAGWAREVTIRQFPIATDIAGVNMRLGRGAVRELHWHKEAEWAYMLYGSARITAVDTLDRHFVADVSEGDLWYFPSGIPHSIQALGDDGCEFLLAFDDGSFSEDSTFLITDWLAHTPKDILGKNFAVPPSTFDKVPQKELYIFNARMPGALQDDLAQSRQPVVPEPFNFRLHDVQPIETRGGRVRIADSSNFKVSATIAAALVEVEPGGLRELHWHPNADEWQYYIQGEARMTIFASESRANTVDFSAGDVGYVPKSMGHYIENTGRTTLRFLELFRADRYEDVSLAGWMANTPAQLVADHLKVDEQFLRSLPEKKHPVLPA
ncbi:cupin domain-containing protein [Paracraurococcus lichenis]|uniref:Cupin domain-containing protein n=1 Tax=Paracraurococcus lichenis TaxID=3064888 RepID=A0ABT9ECM2_9PROT|nr:cupin domain-containing protein [Paracraurococcus sp. LOR1-02]MDO9713958.1 cupin domain-containing protein [Paracraurococcus sp. LOR1-02]